MSKDYKALAGEVDGRAANLFKAAPDQMRAFRGLMDAATKDGALDTKTKELMALAIGIVQRCDGCIVFHVRAAIRHGATREEVAESIGVAIELGGVLHHLQYNGKGFHSALIGRAHCVEHRRRPFEHSLTTLFRQTNQFRHYRHRKMLREVSDAVEAIAPEKIFYEIQGELLELRPHIGQRLRHHRLDQYPP